MLLQNNRMFTTLTRTASKRLLSKKTCGSVSTTLYHRHNLSDSGAIIKSSSIRKVCCDNHRHFSTNGQVSPSRSLIPTYTLFRSELVFTLKFLSPTFKKTNKNNICIDRKGKLQFGFTPRVDGSSMINWAASKHVILGVEDVGTILYNVNNDVSDTVFQYSTNRENVTFKICRANDDGRTTTTISLQTDDDLDDIFREIVLNEGEFEVLKTFFVDSIPRLTAWDSFLNLSIDNVYEHGSNRYGTPDDPYSS